MGDLGMRRRRARIEVARVIERISPGQIGEVRGSAKQTPEGRRLLRGRRWTCERYARLKEERRRA
jgi:hypothetical protein